MQCVVVSRKLGGSIQGGYASRRGKRANDHNDQTEYHYQAGKVHPQINEDIARCLLQTPYRIGKDRFIYKVSGEHFQNSELIEEDSGLSKGRCWVLEYSLLRIGIIPSVKWGSTEDIVCSKKYDT